MQGTGTFCLAGQRLAHAMKLEGPFSREPSLSCQHSVCFVPLFPFLVPRSPHHDPTPAPPHSARSRQSGGHVPAPSRLLLSCFPGLCFPLGPPLPLPAHTSRGRRPPAFPGRLPCSEGLRTREISAAAQGDCSSTLPLLPEVQPCALAEFGSLEPVHVHKF